MSSLRGKILTTYGFSKAILLVFAIVVFVDLYYLRAQILEGAAVNEFREACQEMRREEKNLFLFHETANLDLLFVQLESAEHSLENGRRAFIKISNADELSRVSLLLQQYRTQLMVYQGLAPTKRAVLQNTIRTSGQELLALAESFSSRERAALAHAVRVAAGTLMIVFIIVLMLGVASALFLVSQVVRPLRELELQLGTLAEGRNQHKQLTLPSRDKEIRSFVHHFNAMLKRLQQAVIENKNVFEVLMIAVRVCSLGQITNALFEVGGQYRRNM